MKTRKSKLLIKTLALVVVCLGVFGCSDNDIDIDEGDDTLLTGSFRTSSCAVLTVDPEIEGENSYNWTVTRSASSLYSLTDKTSKTPKFVAVDPGEYELTVVAGSRKKVITVTV